MKYEICFNYMFSRAQQAVLDIFRSYLKELDTTPVQYGLMSYLYDHPGALPVELAEHFGLQASTITGILDRLEKKELVVREMCHTDRRSYKIKVTEKGYEMKEPLGKAVKAANMNVAQMFTEEEGQQLKTLLKKIYVNPLAKQIY
jgi:DNA-binding MarR family transcriptional regulator